MPLGISCPHTKYSPAVILNIPSIHAVPRAVELDWVDRATHGNGDVVPICRFIVLLFLFGNALKTIQYSPVLRKCICLLLMIDIMFPLLEVSNMQVPATGVDVKNPIALETPKTPVVFGEISQDPVNILNYKYSAW